MDFPVTAVTHLLILAGRIRRLTQQMNQSGKVFDDPDRLLCRHRQLQYNFTERLK